jgi:hypothetical protein
MDNMEKGAGHPSGVHSSQPECRESNPKSEAVKTAVPKPKGHVPSLSREQTKRGVN